jgi:hypothetical protein
MENQDFTDFDAFRASIQQLDGRWLLNGGSDWRWHRTSLKVGERSWSDRKPLWSNVTVSRSTFRNWPRTRAFQSEHCDPRSMTAEIVRRSHHESLRAAGGEVREAGWGSACRRGAGGRFSPPDRSESGPCLWLFSGQKKISTMGLFEVELRRLLVY